MSAFWRCRGQRRGQDEYDIEAEIVLLIARIPRQP